KIKALLNTQLLKFGVAGRSCQEVLQKGCLHLQLPVAGSRLCLYEDGTELTGDYFWSVPDNSELVVLTSGQTWQGCKWWGRGSVAGKLDWLWSVCSEVVSAFSLWGLFLLEEAARKQSHCDATWDGPSQEAGTGQVRVVVLRIFGCSFSFPCHGVVESRPGWVALLPAPTYPSLSPSIPPSVSLFFPLSFSLPVSPSLSAETTSHFTW
uniref:DNA fragmentation factor subunit beta n=1 Tax=Ursus maritimus TaxID=29073 RepID=A0A452U3A3_URSMA